LISYRYPGQINGIETGQIFIIQRNIDGKNIMIGKAEVIAVREKLCALRITSLQPGYQVIKEDILIIDIFSQSNAEAIIYFNPDYSQPASKKNYYYEGQRVAEIEYDGGSTMGSGLISGLLFGLIGWSIGYAIMSGKNIDIPHRYVQSLTTQQRMEFSEGYRNMAKMKRISKFNSGAGAGILILIGVYLAVISNN